MIDFISEFEPLAYFPGLVDICKGENDRLFFLVVKDGKATIEEKAALENGTVIPPEAKQLPRQMFLALPDASEVLGWIEKEDDGIFDDLLNYLKRFSSLDDLQLSLTAHYAFLSYLHDHPAISYCPYLLFYAAPERGKSRAGQALTYICFRGFHSVDMREPIIFRFAQNLHGTLFLDLMDVWKRAEKSNCQDLLLLRFQKGVQVGRVLHPDKGAFKDTEYYDIYGPTIFATNEPLHNILGTRCLPITMPNHPGNYENPQPEYALALKARLTAWRAKYLFCALPEIDPIEGISGRLWDITKPLFQIGRLMNPANEILLETAILAIAGDKCAEKSGTVEGKIVAIIHNLSEENGDSRLPEWTIRTIDVTRKFNEERPTDRHVSASWIGIKLTGLSLRKRHINGRSEYIITQADYKALHAQYGLFQKQSRSATVMTRKVSHPTNTLPDNTSSLQKVTGVVGGCRVLQKGVDAKREIFEERAAIKEYEGELSREEAEEAARSQEVPF